MELVEFFYVSNLSETHFYFGEAALQHTSYHLGKLQLYDCPDFQFWKRHHDLSTPSHFRGDYSSRYIRTMMSPHPLISGMIIAPLTSAP